MTKTLCWLRHLEVLRRGLGRRASPERWSSGRRPRTARAMRIDERLAAGGPPLLVRVLPAQDRRGRAQPRPRAGRALAPGARPSCRSPTARAARPSRRPRRSTSSVHIKADYGLEAMAHFTLRRRDRRRAARDARPHARRRDRERARAARRPARAARTSGRRPRAACSYSRELIELIRDEYGFCDRRRLLPRDAPPRLRARSPTCAT